MSAALPPLTPRPHPPTPAATPRTGLCNFLEKKKKLKINKKSKSMRRSKVGLLPPTPGLRVLNPPRWRGLLCFPVARGPPRAWVGDRRAPLGAGGAW